jgi:hypothetical protein
MWILLVRLGIIYIGRFFWTQHNNGTWDFKEGRGISWLAQSMSDESDLALTLMNQLTACGLNYLQSVHIVDKAYSLVNKLIKYLSLNAYVATYTSRSPTYTHTHTQINNLIYVQQPLFLSHEISHHLGTKMLNQKFSRFAWKGLDHT